MSHRIEILWIVWWSVRLLPVEPAAWKGENRLVPQYCFHDSQSWQLMGRCFEATGYHNIKKLDPSHEYNESLLIESLSINGGLG